MSWKAEFYNEIKEDKLTDCSEFFNTFSREYYLVSNIYPMRLPQYYYEVAKKSRGSCLLKTCIPSCNELLDDGEEDTSGEGSNCVIKGVQHKYKNTVLILTTDECAMYCRYCFRKRMVGGRGDETVENIDKIYEYISVHPEVDNVLLSGGDVLMLDNSVIEGYLSKLCAIPQLDFLRLGTKIPVVYPNRIASDTELLQILKHYSKKKTIYMITQFNHPDEITAKVQEVIRLIRDTGVILRNQSVLLKGVNDNYHILCELMNRLVSIGITPYYVFQCRPVKGTGGMFQVALDEGVKIIEKTKEKLNGIAKSFRYICSIPMGKAEIIAIQNDKVLYMMHEIRRDRKKNGIKYHDLKRDRYWIS